MSDLRTKTLKKIGAELGTARLKGTGLASPLCSKIHPEKLQIFLYDVFECQEALQLMIILQAFNQL